MTANTHASTFDELIAAVQVPQAISVDFTGARKGIDNYHVDVQISEAFTLAAKELIEQQVKLVVAGKPLTRGNTEKMGDFRDAYADVLKITLHRLKTDLTVDEVLLLQFALIKFLLSEVSARVDEQGAQLEERLGQQQYAGSRSLLATQDQLKWFRKHQAEFQFRVVRLLLRQLQKEEIGNLKLLRQQYLGDRLPGAVNILFNPMLAARSPQDPAVLLENYALWPDFSAVNEMLEDVLGQELPLKAEPLKRVARSDHAQPEVFDELGGLFTVQALLGTALDQKDQPGESFTWFEYPGNVTWLFDERVLNQQLDRAREGGGLTSGWRFKADIKRLLKVFERIQKSLRDQHAGREMIASHVLRDQITQQDLDLLDIPLMCKFVAGSDVKRILGLIDLSKEGAGALVDKLKRAQGTLDGLVREAPAQQYLKILLDVCRYRLHLKYYRFAHRVFNRLNVIVDPEQVQLAKAGGNLYRLMNSEEVKLVASEEPEIVHHTILKADVRGSTTVTQELIRQSLNPASYFSLRFFGPINERLSIYGATKVFIEGDAVILGFYEHENRPQDWYSVAQACGIAKEMVDIVRLQNTGNQKTGLPLLEIGIGICYSADRPLFLYDENRPIMISSAIGDADRMSSCSWKLRSTFEAGPFNVHVLEIGHGHHQRGEKGQEYIRYNVNGILLDDAAFAKLRDEVDLKRLSAKIAGQSEKFLVGRFPDANGRKRDLVVRQGTVGVWDDPHVTSGPADGQSFYEVLTNNKLVTQIIGMVDRPG